MVNFSYQNNVLMPTAGGATTDNTGSVIVQITQTATGATAATVSCQWQSLP